VFSSLRTLAALAALSFVPWLVLSAFDTNASSVQRLDLGGMVDAASSCLEARVLHTQVELDAFGRPCTRATLLVERDLIGEQRGAIDVRLPGGILPNGSGLVLPGMPSLVEGEELLLFLSATSSAGLRIPVGLAQGKFRVVRDSAGRRRLEREDAPLELLDLATSRSVHTGLGASYDYAAAIAEIQAAVARKNARGSSGGK
jgi:hypothetical protein